VLTPLVPLRYETPPNPLLRGLTKLTQPSPHGNHSKRHSEAVRRFGRDTAGRELTEDMLTNPLDSFTHQ